MNEKNILARTLRKNQTPQESKMWKILRNFQIQGLKFRRQYPIENYIVDFVCKEIKLRQLYIILHKKFVYHNNIVIPNLFRNLSSYKMLKQVQHDSFSSFLCKHVYNYQN